MDNKKPTVPGTEAMREAKEERVENDLLGFLKNDPIEDLSNKKGYSYNFKFSNFETARGHTVEQVRAANTVIKQTGISILPNYRYPTATRRIFGQVPPGQQERRARKTTERKTTRAQVQLLC